MPATDVETAACPSGCAAGVAGRLAEGRRVRRELPAGGRLHIDRPLPFLCVGRRRAGTTGRGDAALGAERLVLTQPAYLMAAADASPEGDLRQLVDAVAGAAVERFGGFLALEFFELSKPSEHPPADAAGPGPSELPRLGFAVAADRSDAFAPTLDLLERELEALRVPGCRPPRVFRLDRGQLPPFEAGGPLGPPAGEDGEENEGDGDGGDPRRAWIGLGVAPAWRSAGGTLYPVVLLRLAHELAPALSRVFDEFSRRHTTLAPPHFHSLGRRAVVRAAWTADRRLAEVAGSYEFLRLCNPADLEAAWEEFRRARCERPPDFAYPPLPIDPEAIKRTLFNLPIEEIEDPTLGRLFREKQEELDRQITMLRDRGGRDFFYGSLQLYGDVEEPLAGLARKLLYRLPAHRREDDRRGYLPAAEMAAAARAETAAYAEVYPGFPTGVELCDDIASGLLVSGGKLLVHRDARFARSRVDALLQHEVGTHLLTLCNGRAQRLRLFAAGLSGYETLQEGLAVLAEFLAGGLSRPRLRLLAARVVACHAVCEGAGFVDTFRELVDDCGYPPREAFDVAVRVHRGGGMTKDACYLRGLVRVLDHLGAGGDLEPLFVGKIAIRHLPVVEELGRRGLVEPMAVRPRWLDREPARARLERLAAGLTPLDLIEPVEAAPAGETAGEAWTPERRNGP
jgi:uncharacterized protein (TIGR02421 family)